MAGTPEAEKQLSRADLVAAAVERNRDIWVRMALRITADVYDAEDAVQEAISKVLTGPGNLVDADAAGRYLTRSVSHCLSFANTSTILRSTKTRSSTG